MREGIVTQLMWQEVPGGFNAGAYRVRRVEGCGDQQWQLEIVRHWLGWPLEADICEYRTLGSARAIAAIHESERVQRLQRQLSGLAAALLSAAWLPHASAGITDLRGFVLSMGLFGLLLWTLTHFMASVVGSEDDVTHSFVAGVFTRWTGIDSLVPPLRKPSAPGDLPDQGKIRILDPFE